MSPFRYSDDVCVVWCALVLNNRKGNLKSMIGSNGGLSNRTNLPTNTVARQARRTWCTVFGRELHRSPVRSGSHT